MMTSQAKFTGEGDAAVDALIEACKSSSRTSLDNPWDAALVGRELQPYVFDEPAPAAAIPNNNKAAGPASTRSQKRKGSPPHRPASRLASPGTSPVSDSPLSAALANNSALTTNAKQGSNKKQHGTAALPSPSRASTPIDVVKAGRTKAAVSAHNSPAPAAGHGRGSNAGMSTSPYACPGMFSSPKPETLPKPSKLLLRAASLTASPPRALVMAA